MRPPSILSLLGSTIGMANALNVSLDTVAVSNIAGAPRLDLTGLFMSRQCTFPNGTLKASANMWAGYGFQNPKLKVKRATVPIISNMGQPSTGGNQGTKNYIHGPSYDHMHDFQPLTISGGLPFYASSDPAGPPLYYNYLLWNTYWSDNTNAAQSPPGTGTISVEAAPANPSSVQVECNSIAQFPFANTGNHQDTQTVTLPGGRYFTMGFVSNQPLGEVILWGLSLAREQRGDNKLQKLGANDFGGQTQGLWTFANGEDSKIHFEFKFRTMGADGVVLILDNGLMCPSNGC